ncbi:DNA alkylation repair protein [Chlamydiia bacterium]|nr:DNA alkylation repair protein [Chlamydiia bacterium]
MVNVNAIISDVLALSDAVYAQRMVQYMQVFKGGYGEGDRFVGLRVGQCRDIAKRYIQLDLSKYSALLCHDVHEVRLTGFLMLVEQYQKRIYKRADIIDVYTKHFSGLNNWDLVDLSCVKLLGHYLLDKPRDCLYTYSENESLWIQRVAIVSTWAFIKSDQFDDTIRIAKRYVNHDHHLIHKATGWMLREVGKRSASTLLNFVGTHYDHMPRIMFHYAMEKMPEKKRFFC